MPYFHKLLCALIALLFSNATFANPIYYEVSDLGAGRFQYDYTVDNQTASPIDEFTVWFDVSVYDNLLIVANPGPDWDGIGKVPPLSAKAPSSFSRKSPRAVSKCTTTNNIT